MQAQKHTPKQLGFSVIEVLIIVLVVAALAVTGLVVYQHHKPSSTSAKNTAATNSPTTTTQPKSMTTTQPATTTTQFLTITEWGVKLPLSSSINDAYYVASNSGVGSDGKPNFFVSLKSLDSTGCKATNNNSGGAGAIGLLGHSPATQTDPVSGELVTQLYPNGTTINGYYYYFQDRTNGLACASQSSLQNISSAFAAAAKGIIAATTIVKIPELGIQITVPDAIKDLTYQVKMLPSKDGSQSPTAYFSTTSLTAIDANCGTDFGPLGALSKVEGQCPSNDPNAVIDYGHLVKQFPTFYITAGYPQAACTTKPAPQGEYKAEFGQAESTIQSLN